MIKHTKSPVSVSIFILMPQVTFKFNQWLVVIAFEVKIENFFKKVKILTSTRL